MSKMVQIRNVPDALHRKLESRAADAGQTLSDYLLAELDRLAARPTRDEMLTRIRSRRRTTLKTPAAVSHPSDPFRRLPISWISTSIVMRTSTC
jgi:hypothetical protein